MKKILALMIAGVLFVISPMGVLATDGTTAGNAATDQTLTGSQSKTAEDILREEVERLTKELDATNEQIKAQDEQIKNQNQQIKTQSAQISALISAVKASNSGGSSGSSGRTPTGPSSPDVRTQALIRNNAVSYGGNIVAQGGHVEINGGRSNVTFLVGVPDGATMNSAASLAANLSGSLINCVNVSSQVAFRSAKVNFYITGVNTGDNVAVYQVQGGKWVQLQTAEIRKDHVVVNMSQTGVVAFIRVPVLATATH